MVQMYIISKHTTKLKNKTIYSLYFLFASYIKTDKKVKKSADNSFFISLQKGSGVVAKKLNNSIKDDNNQA